MKWYGVLPLLAAISLAACQKPESTPAGSSPSPVSPAADPALAASAVVPEYNLGDVDVAILPELSMSERSRSQHIQYTEMRSPLRKELKMANATVKQPLPAELWVRAGIVSPRGLRDTDAVLVRVTLTIDSQQEPIATQAYVFSGKTLTKTPESFETDLVPYLKSLPESVLVLAKVNVVWFPNTDPATITPETADDSKGQTLEKLSNPLRIDFK